MHKRYSRATLDKIRKSTSLLKIIKFYTDVYGDGRNRGTCPFHQDKNPSLSINDERGLWHCFGCGKGGDIFSFMMEKKNISFPDAVKLLASKAGIRLP